MIVSVGEILIDSFIDGASEEKKPGGAPLNVAMDIKAYGGKSLFFGSVGDDDNGVFLKGFLDEAGLDNRVSIVKGRKTTIAQVTLNGSERSFSFLRSDGADYLLDFDAFSKLDFSKVSIVHFGSLMLSTEEGIAFFKKAVPFIRKKTRCRISFDVNYREGLFKSTAPLLEAVKEADIVKMSEEELALLSGKKSIDKGISSLIREWQLFAVSLGANGSMYQYKNKSGKVRPFVVKPIDTTGAGDAFFAYILNELDKNGRRKLTSDFLDRTFLGANQAGAMATTRKGAF